MTRQINIKPRLRNYLTLFCLVIPLLVVSQNQGNIWYFGDHAGLDFNNPTPTPLLDGQTYILLPYGWNEGCSVISDSLGSLLFYTNGEKICNKNHQIMTEGDSLMGHRSSTQSSIIVPQPNSSRYFYVFTTDASENNFQNGLRYSIVDICLDAGLGAVISKEKKNIKLLDSTNEKLLCIRHSNGVDYWIITHKNNTDAFFTFLLTSSGISDTVVSHTGTIDMNSSGATGGQMATSPNGHKIGYAKPSTSNGFTLLLDFDPSTGIVNNEQTLSTFDTEYGVTFSPDNSKIYFSKTLSIIQYNINAGSLPDIIASKVILSQSSSGARKSMQIAPDGKIYIARGNRSFLSAIDFPDSICPACNYIDSAIYLGGQISSWGLPNLICDYSYSNSVYDCITGIDEQIQNTVALTFPNPVFDYMTISLQQKATIEILNVTIKV